MHKSNKFKYKLSKQYSKMGDSGVDDIFDDFETKVGDKERTTKEKELSEEEFLKIKYRKAEQDLKEKYKKEKEALEEKRKKELRGHEETPTKGFPNVEKIAYIAIILVLAVYIVIDVSFNHLGNSMNIEADQTTITAAAVQEEKTTNEIEEVAEEEVVEEKPVEEEKELSGVITLTIDNIYTHIIDKDRDAGEINKIVFTIDNGKDKVLTPIVNVYAYDSEMHESWETRSRGQYTYTAGISPGDSHTGTIDLSPKRFVNLDLKKNLRLVLNSTEDEFITAVNEKVLIE
jgi:hypothetical protein